MKGKSPNQNQKNLFRPILKDIINPKHELVILANQIDWKDFEDSFSKGTVCFPDLTVSRESV